MKNIGKCPETGSFKAWKAVKGNILLQIEIPAGAKRFSGEERKCRASYVKTLKAYRADVNFYRELEEKESGYEVCIRNYFDTHLSDISENSKDDCFRTPRGGIYKIDSITHADHWIDDDPRTCTHGIHFFMAKEDAVDWGIYSMCWASNEITIGKI